MYLCLCECVERFLPCLVYPCCKSNEHRMMDKKTDLMYFLTVSWNGCLIQVKLLSLDYPQACFPIPLPGRLQAFMPMNFHYASFGETYWTDTYYSLENFELNSVKEGRKESWMRGQQTHPLCNIY